MYSLSKINKCASPHPTHTHIPNPTSDLVPEIAAKHFEQAMLNARRSVSDQDLMKYSSFAQSLQQQRNAIGGTGVQNFRFPQSQASATAGEAQQQEDEDSDEDLYS